MTQQVLNEIERLKKLEQAKRWDEAEAGLLAGLANLQSPVDLTEHQPFLDAFIAWCDKHGVRRCPAKPASCAVYVLEHRHRGEEFIHQSLAAIEALHNYYNLPNPARTQLVANALESFGELKAPRSWKQDVQSMWWMLPADIKWELTRREKDRDREVRARQNEAADLRKKLNAETKEETTAKPTNGQATASDQDSRAAAGM